MGLSARVFFLTFSILCFSASYALAQDGPLRTVNSHPLFIAVGAPSLESARPERSFSLGLSYSSLFEVETSGRWSIGMDMEVALVEAEVKGLFLGDRVEAGLYLPFLSYNSGFLDGPLDAYHSALGVGDYGRGQRPEDEFLFEVKRDGETLIKGEAGGFAPGDLRAALKGVLYSGGAVCLSVNGFVELPTGDPEKGYGNGSTDLGASVLIDMPLGKGLAGTLNAGAVMPGDYRARGRIKLREYLYGGAGLNWRYSEGASLVAQIFLRQSPYDTGIRGIDTASALLSLGGRFRAGGQDIEVSFSEDLNTAGAPDFMVGASILYAY